MVLTKEQILTLISLKDQGVSEVRENEIFLLAKKIEQEKISIGSFSDLYSLIKSMRGNAFSKVTMSNLTQASSIARGIISRSAGFNIGLVGYYDEEFPESLRHVIDEHGKLVPPLLLWYKGDLSILKLPGIAVIGTRKAIPEGIARGKYLSKEFAKRGFNIISGLALGCDTSGHQGALTVGGKTTAILGNGLDYRSIYPRENQRLSEEIVYGGGLLLSEYPIGKTVNSRSLVDRDRLQAGLALSTLVVQTGEKGGTMHAANATLKAKKPLYVIKYDDYNVRNHPMAIGNVLLARKGAKYIGPHDDIDKISRDILSFKTNNP